MARELFLLNPYRLPTHHTLMLNAEDVTAFLNGYLALWHPAVLCGASGPPKIASAYDHETPTAGHVYAVPETPQLFLPDDWLERVTAVGATSFRATPNRGDTVANVTRVVGGEPCDPACVGWFAALGFGYLLLEGLFEAMDHLPQLLVEDFWRDVTQALAAADAQACRTHLVAAADRLRETREILYPNTVYFADLLLLNDLPPDAPLPLPLEAGTPTNVIASAQYLERLAETNPSLLDKLRQGLQNDSVDVCSGPYRDRHDALRPIESQLWNLRKGLAVCKQLLGQDVRIHARRRFAVAPQTPSLLSAVGLYKTILLQFDDSVLPTYRAAIVEWPAPDGKRLETFTRRPELASDPNTFFHLAYSLGRTMLQDMTASFVLLHGGTPAAPYYADWLELHRLAPVFGQFMTLSRFFSEVIAGEYPQVLKADELHSGYLDDLTNQHAENPVSRFAALARRRRDLEATWTLAGLNRGLTRTAEVEPLIGRLQSAEDAFELERPIEHTVETLANEALAKLAEKLLSKATGNTPGHLLINPCSFTRRVAVELPGVRTPLPAPARATQLEGDKGRVVVEIPGLGFAWIPCAVEPGTKVVMPRGKPVDGHTLKNEFFEAEIDEQTGGLRTIRDPRRGVGRLGQQLVFGPGSVMKARSVETTSSGPALGEVVAEGDLLDSQNEVLATFRQTFRCWWGRPLLDIRIELNPASPPTGYPWHSCYSARFAWGDPKAFLYRAINLLTFPTSHPRPESPDFFEIRTANQRTAILTGGLPFLQRLGPRMVDVILLPGVETARTFELALALDLDDPIQAAQDLITPVFTIPVTKGPPHVGASGWLCSVDVPSVVLTSLRPAADGGDAIVARLLETRGVGTQAALFCVRRPVRAVLLDEHDNDLGEAAIEGDAVSLYFTAGEMQRVRVEFAQRQ
jgi:hypothetical protein